MDALSLVVMMMMSAKKKSSLYWLIVKPYIAQGITKKTCP